MEAQNIELSWQEKRQAESFFKVLKNNKYSVDQMTAIISYMGSLLLEKVMIDNGELENDAAA